MSAHRFRYERTRGSCAPVALACDEKTNKFETTKDPKFWMGAQRPILWELVVVLRHNREFHLAELPRLPGPQFRTRRFHAFRAPRRKIYRRRRH